MKKAPISKLDFQTRQQLKTNYFTTYFDVGRLFLCSTKLALLYTKSTLYKKILETQPNKELVGIVADELLVRAFMQVVKFDTRSKGRKTFPTELLQQCA